MKLTFRTFSLALFANFQGKLFTSLLQLASHRQVHQGMNLVNFGTRENYIFTQKHFSFRRSRRAVLLFVVMFDVRNTRC